MVVGGGVGHRAGTVPRDDDRRNLAAAELAVVPDVRAVVDEDVARRKGGRAPVAGRIAAPADIGPEVGIGGGPSKSASSLSTKIALLPVHALELRIVSTAVWTNASAFCLRATSY